MSREFGKKDEKCSTKSAAALGFVFEYAGRMGVFKKNGRINDAKDKVGRKKQAEQGKRERKKKKRKTAPEKLRQFLT